MLCPMIGAIFCIAYFIVRCVCPRAICVLKFEKDLEHVLPLLQQLHPYLPLQEGEDLS